VSKTDILIAVNTVRVAGNGGTHGSPVGPLLHASNGPPNLGFAGMNPAAPAERIVTPDPRRKA
jgi:hypothetical protein